MKRTTGIFALLLAGTTMLTSCYKNLKDDIKDLKRRTGDIENILGSNEPMQITTTFVDDNDSTRKVSGTYSLKASNGSTQYMHRNGDGTYQVYVERFNDVEWEEYAWVEFDYNPVTKAITNPSGGHYWQDMDPYSDYVYYSGSYAPAPAINVTINSIDTATGNISFKFSASAPAGYNGSVPNYGKPATTEITFAGKLKVFSTN